MKTVVIILCIVFVVSSLFIGTRFSTSVSEVNKNYSRTLDLIERFEDLIDNTEDLDKIFRILEESQPLIDSLLNITTSNTNKLDSIDKVITAIPEFNIPDIDYIHPSTYEECLGELERIADTAQVLVTIVEHQNEYIELQAYKLETKKGIINTQVQIIDIQERDRQQMLERWEALRQSARRERFISYMIAAGGIAIGIAF